MQAMDQGMLGAVSLTARDCFSMVDFLWKYSCHTILYEFQVYNIVIQPKDPSKKQYRRWLCCTGHLQEDDKPAAVMPCEQVSVAGEHAQ